MLPCQPLLVVVSCSSKIQGMNMSPASAIEVGSSGRTGEATVGSSSGAAVNGPS